MFDGTHSANELEFFFFFGYILQHIKAGHVLEEGWGNIASMYLLEMQNYGEKLNYRNMKLWKSQKF